MKLEVCIGSACHIKGSHNIIMTFQQMIEQYSLADKVELCAVFCLGHCTEAVSVRIGQEIFSVSSENAREFFREHVLASVQG